jgi:hypothetical protein
MNSKVPSPLLRIGSLVLLCGAVLALPAAAEVDVVRNGIDIWRTPAGLSFVEFGQDPIPADFFCSGSPAFTGRIHLRGAPVATVPPGALGDADTVFLRLDDAVFDADGRATTRLQAKAISLVGAAPFETRCGAFDVMAGLAGEQPITEMRIVRRSENAGLFLAPLALDVRLTFTPVGGGTSLQLERAVRFPALPIRWSTGRPARPERPAGKVGTGEDRRERLPAVNGFVIVDTDGDGAGDTSLPGTSNFFPTGRVPALRTKITTCEDPNDPTRICHAIQAQDCHCVD